MAETLDQLLETGWQKLDAADLPAARVLADRAVALDPDSPEAHTLVGALTASEGDVEGAHRAFERAMKLDPHFFEAAYLAAQLSAAAGDLERALEFAEAAIDRTDEEEQFLDALLFKAEVELGLEDEEAATETLAELPPPTVPLPEADFHVRAGACFLELGKLPEADAHFQAATELAPDLGDAYHGLALCAEARGDEPTQVARFQKVRELDLAAPVPEERLSFERIEARAKAALAELPEPAHALLSNVGILIEDYPSEELVKEGVDPRSMGLFAGVPYPEQSSLSGPPHLEQIVLYRRNLERQAHEEEELDAEIRITLLHETAHFFGLDEEELAEIGLD